MKPAVTTPRDALDRPCRTKAEAALDIATAALQHIAGQAANAFDRATAQHALDKIKTLVPEKSQ